MSTQSEFSLLPLFVVIHVGRLKTRVGEDPGLTLSRGHIYPLSAPADCDAIRGYILLMRRDGCALRGRKDKQVVRLCDTLAEEAQLLWIVVPYLVPNHQALSIWGPGKGECLTQPLDLIDKVSGPHIPEFRCAIAANTAKLKLFHWVESNLLDRSCVALQFR